MATPSPAIRLSADGVTWGSPGAKLSVGAGDTVYFKLDSTTDVDETAWKVLTTDDTTTPADFTLTISGPVQSTGTLVAGAAGTAGILQSTINNGVDKRTGNKDPDVTTATIKWYVPASGSGLEVICFDEHGESGSNWWIPSLNAAIRNPLGSVPTGRTLFATSPLTIDGGASADLSNDRTFAINAASAGGPGSMSAAHYSLVNGATSSATASTLFERDANADGALRYLTAQRIIGPTNGLYLYGDASGVGQQIQLLGTHVDAIVTNGFGVTISGGGSQIDVQVTNTYFANETQIELDAPAVLIDGVIRMPTQAAPSPHATLGQLYYSSGDAKLHFLDSTANGGTDHALW